MLWLPPLQLPRMSQVEQRGLGSLQTQPSPTPPSALRWSSFARRSCRVRVVLTPTLACSPVLPPALACSPVLPPALACSPMLTPSLGCSPLLRRSSTSCMCRSLHMYPPQLFTGMTQKQIAEAVHLKHFSDQRLEREARIRERWGWRCTHRHIQGVLAPAFQRPCTVARLDVVTSALSMPHTRPPSLCPVRLRTKRHTARCWRTSARPASPPQSPTWISWASGTGSGKRWARGSFPVFIRCCCCCWQLLCVAAAVDSIVFSDSFIVHDSIDRSGRRPSA
jgi:hypothetical protein